MPDVLPQPSTPHQFPSEPSAFERHYTVSEIAKGWHMCEDTVRRIFANEPGVLIFGEGTRLVGRGKYKRRYHPLRIPESLLQRVRDRLLRKAVSR